MSLSYDHTHIIAALDQRLRGCVRALVGQSKHAIDYDFLHQIRYGHDVPVNCHDITPMVTKL